MAVYSAEKLIEEARKLAAEFRRTTGAMLPISGEIARYDVSHHLDLTLNEQRTGGLDAVGNNSREGLRVQIKSRVIGDTVKSGHRIGQFNLNGDWDIMVLSLMNYDFEPLEMYEATREEILQALSNPGHKRGAISVSKFKIIARLAWTKDSGIENRIYN